MWALAPSPCPPIRAGLHRFPVLQTPRGTRLQRPSFDQRISPSPQRRNMHVDPVIPPIEHSRFVSKLFALLFHQRVRKLLHVVCREIMLVQKDEWLEELNQFLDPL